MPQRQHRTFTTPIPDIHAPIPDTDVPLTLLRTLIRTLGARSLPRLTALARPANRQGSNSSPPSDGTASRTSQETKPAIWRHVGQMSPTTKSSNSSASTANPQPRLRFYAEHSSVFRNGSWAFTGA